MSQVYRLLRFISRLLFIFFIWQILLRIFRKYVHFPAPYFLSYVLDSRLRKMMQPPVEVVNWAGIDKGMHVLEVGPGPGTFTLEAAARVGEAGRITAVDISPAMVARLEVKLEQAGASNVNPRVSSAYEMPLPDESVERVLLVTVLGEIPDRERALAEFRRVLKPDGMLAVGEFLIDPDFPMPQTVVRWCRPAGFQLVDLNGNMLHYVALFKKA